MSGVTKWFNRIFADALTLDDLAIIDPKLSLTADVTVTVGSGGDFATINEAIAYLTTVYQPSHQVPNVTATISLLTGFVMAEQVAVHKQDLSWITISSVDASVTITRSALTTAYDSTYPAFYALNATLPIINTLFAMDTSGTATTRHGLFLSRGSRAAVVSAKGITGAGGVGAQIFDCSALSANGANFSGAVDRCVLLNFASLARLTSAVLSGAGNDGLVAAQGCTVSADAVNVSSAGRYGVHALQGAKVHAGSCTATGCGNIAVFADQRAEINAQSATATGATTNGVKAQQGSLVNIQSANAQKGGSPVSTDIVVATGSLINAGSSTGGLSQTANTLTASGIIFK